jgi:hypothetical protein
MNLKIYIFIIITLGIYIYYNKKQTIKKTIYNNITKDFYKELDGYNFMNEILVNSGLVTNSCKPNGILESVMNNRNIVSTNYFIPCTYDTCERDSKQFEHTESSIFIIDGCDVLASKVALWNTIHEYYGNEATEYMPKTFILNHDKNFIEHFHYNKSKRPDQMYVLKNYEQRQEGIKITRDLDEIINGYSNGWFLVQDYIYNPFLIDRRKINFRYYLLIVCKKNSNNKIDAYLHKDGFLYYTPEYYDEYDMTFNKHITTGYIDRTIYDNNPLTLEDFREYLDNVYNGLSNKWDQSAINLMTKIVQALSTKICKNNKLNKTLRFQLFGCDLAPDSKLGCKLMEINKGPDMNAKDERDKAVKTKVQDDIFSIIENNDEQNYLGTNFIKIY